MNLKAIALATILGLSAPMIADVVLSTHAVAQSKLPLGMYSDGTWSVTISYQDNALKYQGRNLRTRETVTLSGAKVEGDSQRRIYVWTNDNYQYQVSWQPSDPGVIRIQVYDGTRELLNTLLYQQKGD